jgi:hypothetical protein
VQLEALPQGVLGSTGIVAPMELSHLRRLGDIEIYNSLKRTRLKMNTAVVGGRKPQVNTFIYSKACDQTVLVVDMRADRTHTVRRIDMILILHVCKDTAFSEINSNKKQNYLKHKGPSSRTALDAYTKTL